MQKFSTNVQQTNGDALTAASVTVYTDSAHTTKATIYSDNGITVTSNPLTTDTNGEFSFYAADGRYYIGVTKTGVTTQYLDDVLLFDPNASTGSAYVSFTPSGMAPTDLSTFLNSRRETIFIACSSEDLAITAGTAKVTFRMPYAFNVTAVRASLTTASSTGTFTVDINESGTSILSTKLTIDATEKTSTTAATPAVVSDSALSDDAEMTIDVDNAGAGDATGLKVYLIGYKTSLT